MKWSVADHPLFLIESPPSRGAWIEIVPDAVTMYRVIVAPLAGGVD